MTMPDGWRTAFLERTLPLLHCYLNVTSYALSLTIIALSLAGYFSIRSSTNKLDGNPSNRTEISSKMHKKVLKITRGQFVVANIYLFHVLVLALVDTFICVGVVREDMESDPDAWTTQLLIEIGLYCLYLLVIFAASFFLIPLLQMLLITWILARFSNKHSNGLADYIPEARFFSTHIAQIWCMAAFFATGWWAPTSESSFWRYVVLQACIGSATAWLQASFAFNFRSDQLEGLDVASGGLGNILRMFGKTARIVHTYKSADDGLPRYEDVAQDLVVMDEKH